MCQIAPSLYISNVAYNVQRAPNPRVIGSDKIIIVASNYHTFIIDGFRSYVVVERIYEEDPNRLAYGGGYVRRLISETTTITDFPHVNWGWDGDSNGYFSIDVLNTTHGSNYDTGVNTDVDFQTYGHPYNFFTIASNH